jgi:hypothetical protein
MATHHVLPTVTRWTDDGGIRVKRSGRSNIAYEATRAGDALLKANGYDRYGNVAGGVEVQWDVILGGGTATPTS